MTWQLFSHDWAESVPGLLSVGIGQARLLALALVLLACSCSQNQAIRAEAEPEISSPCQMESSEAAYAHGKPIILRVWCSREPIGSPEQTIVDAILIGKGELVVTVDGADFQRHETGPVAAPALRGDQLGASYSVQTYSLQPGSLIGVHLELEHWSSNQVRFRITEAPPSSEKS